MAVLALTRVPSALETLRTELSDLPLVVAEGTSAGLEELERPWTLVLLDEELDRSTLPLLERLAAGGRRVALMSRTPTLRLTVHALRHGAEDVLALPPDPVRLRELVEACAPEAEAAESEPAGEAAVTRDGLEIIGRSPALLEGFRTVARVANSPATVLLRGESGTGKELLAQLIHEHSERACRPFVAVNCAAIPENLLESELFGHEKGSFEGALARRIGRVERASGGTLFLDEVGDMSVALQSRLLRVLEQREIERIGGDEAIRVDLRAIAATNRNLEAEVASGRFREDLYYRLAVVQIELPPLRARGDDIRMLAEHFLRTAASNFRRPARRIDPAALSLLRNQQWPGNVRQLRNVIERAVLMAEGTVLRPAHLPPDIRAPLPSPADEGTEPGTLAEIEKRYIERVLDQTGGHMSHAAEVLGIHRNTLRRKLEAYGLA
jgi:DNA-binding NtrC family response regulator